MNIVARKQHVAPTPRPEEIRARLDASRVRMSELLVEQQQAAEASLISADGERRYNEIIAEMASTSGEIDRLEAALAAMERRAGEERSAQQRAEQAALRERVAAKLDQRIEAARKFEAGIKAAVGALADLSTLSNDAYAAWPALSPPDGAALGNAEIVILVSHELYRLGVHPLVTGGGSAGRHRPPNLPGPKCPDFSFTDQPDRIPTLVAAIEQANAHAKGLLEGRR
jgi:hypothetical protein